MNRRPLCCGGQSGGQFHPPASTPTVAVTGEKAQLGRLVGVSGRGNRSAAPDAGGGGPAAVSWPGCTPSLSLIKVLGIDGPVVIFAGVDLFDGIPVIDLKPYVSRFGPPSRGAAMRLVPPPYLHRRRCESD
ncbi:MAG TPA: hypothetical protein DHU96_14730 [Actinobacteria bacterium]|nr:hypothetical protein [Actinomycetota bacterium]